MSREELIEEIRLGIKDKRLLEAASIGAVEIDGKLIAIKSRYEKEETKELLKDRDRFIVLDESNSFGFTLGHTFAIYDHSLFNLRGVKALDELEEDLRKKREQTMSKLKPCPFCGGEVIVGVVDEEGNQRDEEYVIAPWSGLSFTLNHEYGDNPEGCPIAHFEDESLGTLLYDSREEAIEAWNRQG